MLQSIIIRLADTSFTHTHVKNLEHNFYNKLIYGTSFKHTFNHDKTPGLRTQ